MSNKNKTGKIKEYHIHYEVKSILWKHPFDRGITDESDYFKYKKQNLFYDLKTFTDVDPLKARRLAMNYLQSMIEVLCESVGKQYCNYWQAIKALQTLFRADHPMAHQRIGSIQFDDDMLCGVTMTMVVEKGKKRDDVTIFSLGVYDDDIPEDILSDVVYTIIELTRERSYYNLARIPVKTEQIDLSGIGMSDAEVMPSLMDFKDFAITFRGIDIDDVIDTNTIYHRQCELLIH